MYHATTLDARTLIVRCDVEGELTELLAYINRKAKTRKQDIAHRLLAFAHENYAADKTFRFNREECYER